jgi:prepilin-type N-terminal cleavage/methylation domain-containing protein
MDHLKKGFTLVELIVVITILAILWTIAFISLQWYSRDARDSVRIQDIANIKKSLEIFVTESWLYPNPSDSVDITYSWWIVWSQWTVWDSVVENVWKLNKKPVDPVLATEYSYSRTNNKTEYELSGILEWWWTTHTNIFNQATAATPYRALVGGNYNGQVLKVSTWWLDYILALPSITTTDTATTDIVTTTTNKSLVYNGEYNLPSNYSWIEWFTTTWWFEYAPADIVAFSWTTESLTLWGSKIKLIENLQRAYSWSILSLKTDFTELLSIDTENNTDGVIDYALNLFQNVPQFNKSLKTSSFDPTYIWGIQLWLDADATDTITKDGSNKVSQWNDRSGNENHATQWTSNEQPTYLSEGINYKPTLRFDGNSDWLAANGVADTFNSDFTMYLVSELASWFTLIPVEVAAQRSAADGTAGVKSPQYNTNGTAVSIVWNLQNTSDDNDWREVPLIYEMSTNYTELTSSFRFNGSANTRWDRTVTQPSTVDLFSIGQEFDGVPLSVPSNFYRGDISEVIIYNKILTASEKNKVNAYLGKKWWINVPEFSLSSISNLELWLDASDASSITQASSKVSQWNDKSGNGNNLTQSTEGSKPVYSASALNSKAGISFDGTDDTLGLWSQLIWTWDEWDIFAVVENNNLNKDSYMLSQWDSAFSTRTIFMWHYSDAKLSAFNGGGYEPRASTVMVEGNPYLLGSSYDGTNMALSVNGVEEATLNAGSITLADLDLHLWSSSIPSRFWTGDVGEVVVFKRKLTDFEADQVVNYLNTKWWL